MTKQEISLTITRLKNNNPNMMDWTIENWQKQLKDYSYQDVNSKLDDHYSNERYSAYEPKIEYILKFLKKENEKINEKDLYAEVRGEVVHIQDVEKTLHRYNAIDFIEKKTKQHFGKQINRLSMLEMNEEEFDLRYNNFLTKIVDLEPEGLLKKVIQKSIDSLIVNTKLDEELEGVLK